MMRPLHENQDEETSQLVKISDEQFRDGYILFAIVGILGEQHVKLPYNFPELLTNAYHEAVKRFEAMDTAEPLLKHVYEVGARAALGLPTDVLNDGYSFPLPPRFRDT